MTGVEFVRELFRLDVSDYEKAAEVEL